MTNINFVVNGIRHQLAVKDNETLLDVLRDRLGLTGAKKGCDIGECGTCTVVVDGEPILSCITLAVEMEGKRITTIEGLAQNGELHPLQKAFHEHGAVQCGFCTPGMIMSGKALLDKNPKPTEQEVRRAISGNSCRCTGYDKPVKAILAAAEAEIQ
ncbi:(2Fe-2S)-binding protein [Paradesulfitobacterium ferrireducens]|uniref:(2Fe-2S)-binding protein n=1 Tax=Paradesulfitobacterium ferrireducens TaxID=2816476 RepID=UPI001A8E9561|nr:(2Fe-2S)-binding protein [Paradesulfitobacterium ferrireducens]